jgi:hypothetical protein
MLQWQGSETLPIVEVLPTRMVQCLFFKIITKLSSSCLYLWPDSGIDSTSPVAGWWVVDHCLSTYLNSGGGKFCHTSFCFGIKDDFWKDYSYNVIVGYGGDYWIISLLKFQTWNENISAYFSVRIWLWTYAFVRAGFTVVGAPGRSKCGGPYR